MCSLWLQRSVFCTVCCMINTFALNKNVFNESVFMAANQIWFLQDIVVYHIKICRHFKLQVKSPRTTLSFSSCKELQWLFQNSSRCCALVFFEKHKKCFSPEEFYPSIWLLVTLGSFPTFPSTIILGNKASLLSFFKHKGRNLFTLKEPTIFNVNGFK